MLFAHRLLVSYGSSLSKIRYRLDSTPPSLRQEKIIKSREELIYSFCGTEAGKNWMESMRYQQDATQDAWRYTAIYFYEDESRVSTEAINKFFLTLDEIGILTSILQGNGETYGISFEPQALDPQKVSYDFLIVDESEREGLKERLLSLMQGDKKPKMKVMPICAAIKAGVMPRLSYEDFKTYFDPAGKVSKSTYNNYTNPYKNHFFDEAFNLLVEEFREMAKASDKRR